MGWFDWLKRKKATPVQEESKLEATDQDKTTQETPNKANALLREIHTFEDLPKQSSELIHNITYPPRDAPVPVISTDDVLCTQVELIRQIKESVPMTEEEKDELLFPVIRNLANYVNLLPASQSHHHNGRGGLFCHSLEVGLYAVRMGKMRIFDVNADPVAAYKNKGRWFLAIAIAGFLHDVGKCITDMTITSTDGKNVWMPSVESLSDWIQANGCSEYYLAWNIKRIHGQHENASLSLLNTLVPMKTLRFLESAHSAKLKGEFYEALNGTKRKDSVITELILKADSYSTQRDLNRQIREGVHPGVNAPIATHVLNIIEELIQNQEFQINVKGEALIVSDKGVFLVWSRAIGKILNQLVKNRVAGVPKDDMILAEKLCESGIAEILFLENNLQENFWSILPASEYLDSKPDEPVQWNYLNCLKISDGAALFANRQRPANTVVLIRQIQTTEEDREAWRKCTNLEPPHGQNWITGALSSEQDRDAQEYQHSQNLNELSVMSEDDCIFVNDFEANRDCQVYPVENVQQILNQYRADKDVPEMEAVETGEVVNDNLPDDVEPAQEEAADTADTEDTVSQSQPEQASKKPLHTRDGFLPIDLNKEKTKKSTKSKKSKKSKNAKETTTTTSQEEGAQETMSDPDVPDIDADIEVPMDEDAADAYVQAQMNVGEAEYCDDDGNDDVFSLTENDKDMVVVSEQAKSESEKDQQNPSTSQTKPKRKSTRHRGRGREKAKAKEREEREEQELAKSMAKEEKKADLCEIKAEKAAKAKKSSKENIQSAVKEQQADSVVVPVQQKTPLPQLVINHEDLPSFILVKDEWASGEVSKADAGLYARYLLWQLVEELKKGGGRSLTSESFMQDDALYCPDYDLIKALQSKKIGFVMAQCELRFFPMLTYETTKHRFKLKKDIR